MKCPCCAPEMTAEIATKICMDECAACDSWMNFNTCCDKRGYDYKSASLYHKPHCIDRGPGMSFTNIGIWLDKMVFRISEWIDQHENIVHAATLIFFITFLVIVLVILWKNRKRLLKFCKCAKRTTTSSDNDSPADFRV